MVELDEQFDNSIMPLYNEWLQDKMNSTACMIQIHWVKPFTTVTENYDLQFYQGHRVEYETSGYYYIEKVKQDGAL